MKHKVKLIRQFAYLISIFIVITITISAFVTYFSQMKQLKIMCKSRIMEVGNYLVGLIMEDPQDFLNYQKYYEEHYKDLRIPVDFDNYTEARDKFFSTFRETYPGKTYKVNVMPDELTDELKLLYYTYRHEYWLLTFEQSRESFSLPYTYYLVPNEDTHETVYMIDGERTEDHNHPGYLYMGDSYYEEPSEHRLMWNTYLTGQKYDDVYEWNNGWGNTYSYYTPLVINDECIGLVVTEINVSDVKDMILRATLLLVLQLGAILIFLATLLLFFINKYHISRINHLAVQVEDFSTTRAYDTVDAIRAYPYGNDEISVLAGKTADMIGELQVHEAKVAQAAQFKSDFLANMSHEIRTPMNAIIGLSDLILKEQLPDKTMEYVRQLHTSANSMLVVISDILDFSKLEAGTLPIVPADYNVREVISGIVNVTSMGLKEKPVVMKLSIAPDIPQFLHGDNLRIGQVLSNIISNAVKFTREGSISISVDQDRIDENNINLKIWVTDTGIGIRPEDYERIFESFSQVNSRRDREVEGTGLGLAISQRLIRLMKGDIEVESEYGSGSTFKLTFPQEIVHEGEAVIESVEEQAEEVKKFRAPAARILVVDDNSVNLYVARNLLALYDIKPTCVLSGELAIKAVEKRDYDLILMDYMMPGMDGIEAAHRIREQYPAYKNIPIIAFTANAVEEARELLLKEGMDDFISKPVKGTELEALLKKWLPEKLWG